MIDINWYGFHVGPLYVYWADFSNLSSGLDIWWGRHNQTWGFRSPQSFVGRTMWNLAMKRIVADSMKRIRRELSRKG